MAVYFGAIASFVIIFVALMWRMTNEVLIARRYVSRRYTGVSLSCSSLLLQGNLVGQRLASRLDDLRFYSGII